ncbi:hypothetical protein PILCRDRAFT_821171 [Piloderma croceum F 1598]|uniref:Protein kinase domain-containing protein n=1 Tax=Piloderma croceum (strain F 1598) TaxID=765440 RepID=A0A0C3FAX7_PILCF|nr:hypothetical protein PILCRDRAFT_821171 [Piloderma croceum F 1598]
MPPESPVHPITTNLPSNLVKWREYHTIPRFAIWEPLRDWFRSEGLHVFDVTGDTTVKPPTNEPRAHDGVVYGTHYGPPNLIHEHRRPIHCIARTDDGRDVLIRLIAKAGQGLEEFDILQHVATGHRAFLGDNHCLPMLRSLVLDDMIFGVFPFMERGFTHPWYHNPGEVFDAVLQVLQGFEFLHRHLIAHRDVGADNILINLADGRLGPPVLGGGRPLPFRELFPVRYYIIDFEYSVRFPEDSAPDQRVVTGLPGLKYGSDHPDDYGRDLSPEMLLPEPHCPFKSDVYQLGKMFLSHFHPLETEYPDLVKVFRAMTAVDPSCRPTVAEALKSIDEYHNGFTRAQLKILQVPEPLIDPIPIAVRFQKMEEAIVRKAAKKRLEAELAQNSPAAF